MLNKITYIQFPISRIPELSYPKLGSIGGAQSTDMFIFTEENRKLSRQMYNNTPKKHALFGLT